MHRFKNVFKHFGGNTWKFLSAIAIPLLWLPLPLLSGTKESRCGYVILLMACYWMLEPIPLAATSLLPIVLFPLLGVISTSDASTPYMNATNMMFVGGLFMAVAIENCNLHKRIALNVLMRVGSTASWMMLGFMATAMFLSMWISNTATAALMVPIIDAVLSELEMKGPTKDEFLLQRVSIVSTQSIKSVTSNKASPETPVIVTSPKEVEKNECLEPSDPKEKRKAATLRKAMFLSIAYATNVGGTGTLTGTGPNLVVKGIVEELFPESNDLSFDKWMMFNVPVMLICVCIAWAYLHVLYVRKSAPKNTKEMSESFKQIIAKKHDELGAMTFQEKAVSFLFAVLVMLWIFRDPHFVTGWGQYFPLKVKDATPAIGIPLLLFLIPAEPWRLSRSPALISWKVVQEKMPWGVIILLGGGFSLAEGSKQSGLSVWASQQLASLNIPSPVIVVGILCLLTAILTEFTSNVATANVLLPVVAQLAIAMEVHPIYYMLPVTISCSFAFMLPVATPPNAIVFESGKMKTMDMVKPGFFMNILCVAVEVLMINTLGSAIFDFKHFPQWANITVSADKIHI